MCGKYTLLARNLENGLISFVEICVNYTNCPIVIKDDGSICPDDPAPALVMMKSKATPMAMRWGFHTTQDSRLIINARSESVDERVMFRQLVNTHRCALPAGGYFEWRNNDNLRHLISRADGQLLYLAGLYRFDENGVPRFVVLTRDAYGPHAKIHNRMPCLLHSREEARQWISGQLALDELRRRADENLSIEAQEAEQLSMDFPD